MEPPPFLGRPQDYLRIVSWNINGVKTKIEKDKVQELLLNFDIISLNEIKTPLAVSFPGFVSYSSYDKHNPHRGGTCVLVKQQLSGDITEVDVTKPDQVWCKLKCVPGVLFGFCYVPPHDSPYFNHSSFSAIQEKIKSTDISKGCVIFGDINARFGNSVCELPTHVQLRNFSYPYIPDPVQTPNDNASILLSMCIDNQLLVVNNACVDGKHYPSKLTYRQGTEWISELDICAVSRNMVECVHSFSVLQNFELPSDHAPISLTLQPPSVNLDSLSVRASNLGDHAVLYSCQNGSLVRKSIKFHEVNQATFLELLCQHDQPVVEGDAGVAAQHVSDVLYECASASRITVASPDPDTALSRWERLLANNDEAQVWRAINWHGEVNHTPSQTASVPTDQQFKEYFEEILNPENVDPIDDDLHSNVYIPVLDDPITPQEVSDQLRKLKGNKACGPDGVPPGILKVLPATWVLTITALFNNVFMSALYPPSWISARLFTIFKRGSRVLVANYRGITIINSLAKLYDMVICDRLCKWFRPFREQAGSQAGRGCLEHIVILRLLTDIARRKKFKLFVTFVDFSQAYDKVPRSTLFRILKRLGCGALMLMSIVAMYRITKCVIGTALVTATVGVRQGSPSSCLLFVLFVNDFIRLIKQNCGVEGFLAWLHILAFMDDTVLLAISRDSMIAKIGLLKNFCTTHGMKVNIGKTKFFVINGSEEDKRAIHVDGLTVEPCDQYIYLGSPFTADGSTTTAIKVHAQVKMCHILKFVSFINKNNDVPFYVKRKVFDAALMSSILYGCESWLNGDLRLISKLYNWCIKQLLGVRKTTSNNLCLVELGYPPLNALVTAKQRKFFRNMWAERNNVEDDPFAHAVQLMLNYNSHTSRYVRSLIFNEVDDIQNAMNRMKQDITISMSSRFELYRVVNPNYNAHDIYTTKTIVNELERISWTRLRVSAHSLAIEQGRWNRRGRGRLPIDERVCTCGQVQTERHVIEICPQSLHLREQYNFSTLEQLFVEHTNYSLVCKIIHKILNIYK